MEWRELQKHASVLISAFEAGTELIKTRHFELLLAFSNIERWQKISALIVAIPY